MVEQPAARETQVKDERSSVTPVEPERVSVSVVSHGQTWLVTNLLADIFAHVQTPIEIILTLNLPEARPPVPEQFSFPLRILENTVPKGFAANHNAAFRASRGGVFCVLNPDIRIELDPFPALLKCLRDRSVGVAAPMIRSPTGTVEDSARRFPTPLSILRKAFLRRLEVDYPIKDVAVYPDWVAGMFMVFPRDVFAALRGFDERYFLYYEDVDLCARLAAIDRRVVVSPEASVVHAARRESRRSFRYLRWHLSSMLRFFLRHPMAGRRRGTGARTESGGG